MKQERLNFYFIDMKYVRELAKADDNVMSVSPQAHKQSRPFVGVIVLVNNRKYCVPLTSPKPKFETIKNGVDFLKILHPTCIDPAGTPKIIGGLNFNNMLPVSEEFLQKIDIQISSSDGEKTKAYKQLLRDQLEWCRANDEKIIKTACKLYDLITKYADKNRNLAKRCCDFARLEAVLDKMIKPKELKQGSPTPFRKMLNERLAKANAPKQAQTQPTKQPSKKRKK